jgi:hypothetical protein
MQAQIAPRQAQKSADPAISQRDALQAQLDAISQGDALQAQLEDAPLGANRRDSLQNQPKTGEAGANPSQQDVVSVPSRSPRFGSGCLATRNPRQPSLANPGRNALQKGRASSLSGTKRMFEKSCQCQVHRRDTASRQLSGS